MTSFVPQRNDDNLEPNRKTVAKNSKGKLSNKKNLQKPKFIETSINGGVVMPGEADSVVAQVQDARYGSPLTGNGKGGDFANKIVIGVGFLNDGKTSGAEIDLTDPNLRYTAGLTIYQRTDTGKDNTFFRDLDNLQSLSNSNPNALTNEQKALLADIQNEKTRRTTRMATTLTPQTAVSVLDMTADVVNVKSRNGGINLIAGYDYSIPRPGSVDKETADNVNIMGVSLIGGGNPSTEDLNDAEGLYGLQSIPKGENLQEALQQIANRLNDNAKVTNKIIRGLAVLETALLAHTHVVQAGPFPGIAVPSIDLGITGGTIRIPALVRTALSSLTSVYNSAVQKVNMSVVSEGYINSRWNKTN